jgi:hypothetical protein
MLVSFEEAVEAAVLVLAELSLVLLLVVVRELSNELRFALPRAETTELTVEVVTVFLEPSMIPEVISL